MLKEGSQYSWRNIDINTIELKCDRAFFINNCISIPYEYIVFFFPDYESSAMCKIRLIYENTYYTAMAISRKHDNTLECRLEWQAEFGRQILKTWTDKSRYMQLYARFLRKIDKTYEIVIISRSLNKKSTNSSIAPDILLKSSLKESLVFLGQSEEEYTGLYIKALDICDSEEKLREQIRLTNAMLRIQDWKNKICQLIKEISVEHYGKASSDSRHDCDMHDGSSRMKIGKYVQACMNTIESERITFSQCEWNQLMDANWCKKVLRISKSLIKIRDPLEKNKVQISDSNGNNRYWKRTYHINGKDCFICSQWYNDNWDAFTSWISPILKRADGAEISQDKLQKTPDTITMDKVGDLPSAVYENSEYVYNRFRALEQMGNFISQEEMRNMMTIEWSFNTFKLRDPVLVPYEQGRLNEAYWSMPFAFSGTQVYVYGRWEAVDRNEIECWFEKNICVTAENEISSIEKNVQTDLVRLTITDYKMRKK
jgi:hypothetical protein